MESIRAQKVVMPDGMTSWTVLDGWRPIEPIEEFMSFATLAGRAANTLRAYAFDLSLFWRFLRHVGLLWSDVSLDHSGRFLAWLQRPPAEEAVVDLRAGPARGRATLDRAISTVFRFYDFHSGSGAPIAQQLNDHAGVKTRRDAVKIAHKGTRRPVRVGRSERLPKTITLEDFESIIKSTTSMRDRLLLALWWSVGLRVGQTLGLRHEDFDGRDRTVRVLRRDNANDAWAKNRQETLIPVTQEIVVLHREYMFEEYGEVDSDYVFVALTGPSRGAPLSSDAVAKMVRRLRKRSGIEFTPHMLRHSFATDFIRNGGRIEVLSRLLTHSSIESTKVYLHLTSNDLRGELERLS